MNLAQEAFHAAKRDVLDRYMDWIGGNLIAAAKARADGEEFDVDQSTKFMAEVDVHTNILQVVLDERNKLSNEITWTE